MSDATPTLIRFGILGCANISRKLSRAIAAAPNAIIYAVGSRSLAKVHAYAAANSLPATTKLYGSYDAVLDDADVDTVYIPLPTSLHLRWVVAAARKGKHVVVEKPTAVNVAELDEILKVCEECGVQFMDGTMWMHHPRTAVMAEFLKDSRRFGRLRSVQTCYTLAADDDFLEYNIRVRPDLDSLGALGDLGWYCIRAILFATDYNLPNFVTALQNPVKNNAGVILSCGASLHWEDGVVGTFHCSFLSNLTMDMSVLGTKGTLHVSDYVIPYKEKSASFTVLSEGCFTDMDLEWNRKPSEHIVETELPQEVLMVKEFSTLVDGIKRRGLSPEKKWPILSRKTQLVIDAVVTSIDRGFEAVEICWDR